MNKTDIKDKVAEIESILKVYFQEAYEMKNHRHECAKDILKFCQEHNQSHIREVLDNHTYALITTELVKLLEDEDCRSASVTDFASKIIQDIKNKIGG